MNSPNNSAGSREPIAFVHVDVDGWWAVRRCYDDASVQPDHPDPVYEEGLPALHRLFGELKIPASFFVIGRDAEIPRKRLALGKLAKQYPVENHSYSHDLGLAGRSPQEVAEEIDRAHEAIASATGHEPVGFRAPGYSWNAELRQCLADRGYEYDSSLLPTWAGPALRLTDAWLRGARPKRHQYGPWSRVFASRWPQAIGGSEEDGSLRELPVLVSSPWRTPIPAGSLFARGAGALRATLKHLSGRPEPVLFLLHGIDAVDTRGDRHPIPTGRGRRFFHFSQEEKLEKLRRMLVLLAEHRKIVDTRFYLSSLRSSEVRSEAEVS